MDIAQRIADLDVEIEVANLEVEEAKKARNELVSKRKKFVALKEQYEELTVSV